MLHEIISADVFKLLTIFIRIGAAVMFFPAFGGVLTTVRIRILLSLLIAFLLLGPLSDQLPAEPASPWALVILLLGEATVGVFIGTVTQFLMATMDLAGTLVGYNTGLTNALVSDPVTDQQSQLVSGMLNLAAVTLLLITDMHHLMLQALVDSYQLFKPGQPLMTGDMAQAVVRILGASFVMGTRLAAPLIVFSLLFNCSLGVINRLVPQMQVFFVGLPMQILAGLAVLALAFPVMMLWFLTQFHEGLRPFLASPG